MVNMYFFIGKKIKNSKKWGCLILSEYKFFKLNMLNVHNSFIANKKNVS